MRFWKFIKDEIQKIPEQQSPSPNNDSEQFQHDSIEESNLGEKDSIQDKIDDTSAQQDLNNSQNDQLNQGQQNNNSTKEQDNNSKDSATYSDKMEENKDRISSEEQEMSNSQLQPSERQDQQSLSQKDSSEQEQEFLQPGEEQKMSGSQSQQSEANHQNNNSAQEDSNQNSTISLDGEEKNKEKLSVQEQLEHISEEITNTPKLTNDQKRELLKKLKKNIKKIRKRKAEKLQREHINAEKQEVEEKKEEKYELSEQTNNFLNQLGKLPSFEDRDRGAGYSIDTETYTDVSESIIRTLITKFLNQRFCKHTTDLNIRSNSLEKTNGFYKWEVKDVIVHLQTHQVTKVLTDKYGYEYANGKSENIPLSFYFDMSGSMSSYTNMLAVIAIELLKKKVKVLIGFNERVNVQIESIEKNITVSELADILESAGYWDGWGSPGRDGYKKDSRVRFKYIEKNIDNYLIEKKAEKCVVFSDFDPKDEVVNLSQIVDVYWFCFESRYDCDDIDDFNGFIYKVQNIRDLEQGLLKVNEKRFETLCYTDNPKRLQKKARVKR